MPEDIQFDPAHSPRCGVCARAIHEDWFACPSCGALHHLDCFQFNDGCAVYACSGRGRPADSGGATAPSPAPATGDLVVRRDEEGVIVHSRRGRLGGILGLSAGAGLIALGMVVFPVDGIFLGVLGIASCLIGGRMMGERLEIRAGGIRIHGFTGARDFPATEITTTRLSWMGALQIFDRYGTQIFWYRSSPAELDRVCELLTTVAGIRVD